MFWLYLLGAVTILAIVLRRVWRRQTPLKDELYSSRVAIDHVQSGVAWVTADGKLGLVNQSLGHSLGIEAIELVGGKWLKLFAMADRERASNAYSEMLLRGITRFEALGAGPAGAPACLEAVLVAVHDHNTRLVGHYCLIRDCTRERELEGRLHELESTVATAQ